MRPGFLSLLLVLVLTSFKISAQNAEKYGFRLALRSANDPQRITQVFIRGNAEQIKQVLPTLGGEVKYCYGPACAISIPAGKLPDLAAFSFVDKIEDGEIPVTLLMDTSLINNRITGIHQGLSPLPHSLTGQGVIAGFIDGGIYFQHGDFLNPDSSTRVLNIWDMNDNSGPAPAGFSSGTEWTAAQINQGLCAHAEPANQFGHGTHVAGICSGNGMAVNNYKGVAPETDIIMVAFNYNQPFLSGIVDAVKYIFEKADQAQRPCVINASLGTYYGGRDGKDIASQLIDSMLNAKPGRALVAAAGNAGHVPYHLGYEVTPDSSFTWFNYNSSLGAAYWEMWADSLDFINVQFAVGADDQTNYTKVAVTRWMNIVTDYNLSPGQGVFVTEQLMAGSNAIATVFTFGELQNGVYHLEIYVVPTAGNTGRLWRFMTKGTGHFDCWTHPQLTGQSLIVNSIPSASQMPEIIRYKLPDTEKTITSSFQCSDKVITVGNYSNRHSYPTYLNSLHITGETPGQIFGTSSHGPTRDNRLKPDVCATGSTTLATGNLSNIASLLATNQGVRVAPEGLHSRNGGTSMAAPIVSGIVALYLEKNPNATWQEIKTAVIQNAFQDVFTGNSPNPTYGHGKADGFQTVLFTPEYGCTDPNSLNFNPNANMDDGSCEYPYCPVQGLSTANGFIQTVCLDSICHTGGNNNGYGNFTHLFSKLKAGSQYSLQLVPSDTQSVNWKVYIDFNKDRSFGADEMILDLANQTGIVNFSFTVPIWVEPGISRIRIMMGDDLTGPCNDIPNGEVVDYSIIFFDDYCESPGNAAVWIETFCGNNACFNTGNNGGYHQINTSAALTPGMTITFSLNPGVTIAGTPVYVAIYGDWNLDGRFHEEEKIYHTAMPQVGNITGTFTIPDFYFPGKTKLRVIVSEVPILNGCPGANSGEIEDYLVRLRKPESLPYRVEEPFSPEKTEEISIEIWPNPAQNFVNLAIGGISSQAITVSIYTPAGKKVWEEVLPSSLDINNQIISVEGWKSGVYFILIQSENIQKRSKLLIMY